MNSKLSTHDEPSGLSFGERSPALKTNEVSSPQRTPNTSESTSTTIAAITQSGETSISTDKNSQPCAGLYPRPIECIVGQRLQMQESVIESAHQDFNNFAETSVISSHQVQPSNANISSIIFTDESVLLADTNQECSTHEGSSGPSFGELLKPTTARGRQPSGY